MRYFSPTSSHFQASVSKISIVISTLQHHSQEVIVYILQFLFMVYNPYSKTTKTGYDTLNLITLQHLILKKMNYLFFRREETKGFLQCSFQISNFLASLRAPQFNLPTTAVALFLKYPRFTCKKYFKPRFRFILSGKVTFNQIWTFRPRKWNILTTLLTMLSMLIWSKQRTGFYRQSNLVNCRAACTQTGLQLCLRTYLSTKKKNDVCVPYRLLTFECNRKINHSINCRVNSAALF